MINSVRRFGWEQQIWVLCLSSQCEETLTKLALPQVHTLSLDALELHIPELRSARQNRTPLEYYFTCMAALHTYVFDKNPGADCTMYVDADMQFFASPEIVFDEIGDAPVAVTPHNFPSEHRDRERYGVYNAGWTAFRRNEEGRACLRWWLERSLEWCCNWLDNERYANQKYLNYFSRIAPHTKVLTNKGFNCAPWNVANYEFSEAADKIYVDGEPLVFFHFHSVKKLLGYFYFDCHRDYDTSLTCFQRNKIYRPYIRELVAMELLANRIMPGVNREKLVSLPPGQPAGPASSYELRKHLPGRIQLMDLLLGRAVLAVGNFVW
jgi:hypothetical protein